MRLRDGVDADQQAIHRTWIESAWLDRGDEDDDRRFDVFHRIADWVVGVLDDGRVEAAASRMAGTIRHVDTELPLSAVTSVNVGRVARGQGLASGTTALGVARGADEGAAVAALGMFDQGFYDRVGFGNLSPWTVQVFDPADLLAPWGHRPPQRLTLETDGERIHRAWMRRRPVHGQLLIDSVERTVVELGWTEDEGIGLGYGDDDGELTHLLWMGPKGDHGPYHVSLPIFRDGAQLRELLSLLRSLAGQVRTVRFDQPADLSLQELLRNPHRTRPMLDTPPARALQSRAQTWHQARILDLPACMAAVRTHDEVRFVADVSDPITDVLARHEDVTTTPSRWRGVGGRWAVTLGERSGAEPLADDAGADLPVLRCSVNELTRMWLGVRPASQLAMVADLDAEPALLEALDDALRMPAPHFDADI